MDGSELILAFDTSTDYLSVAVWRGRVLAEVICFAPKRHSELLPKYVDFCLGCASLAPDDVDYVAVGVGPGSYTGLRVGVSFAQGFAFACGAKVVPVGSFEAMAGKYSPCDLKVAIISDARAGKVYGAIFDVATEPYALVEPATWTLTDFAKVLSLRGRVLLCGDGVTAFIQKLRELVHGTDFVVPSDCGVPSAAAAARIAQKLVRQGNILEPEDIEPRYLRSFVPGKRKRRSISEQVEGGGDDNQGQGA